MPTYTLSLTLRKISLIRDMPRLQDSEVTLLSIKISILNYNLKRSIWRLSSWIWERETVRMLKKLISSTTKMKWSPKNLMIWPLRPGHLNMTFRSSLLVLMTWINWSILKHLIWRARRLNWSNVKVRSSNWKIKWSVSKMSWITSRLLRTSIVMKMLTFRRESTPRARETLSWRPVSRISNLRLDLRRTKLCTWGKSLKEQDTVTQHFWITIQICRLRLIHWTTIFEWSQCRTRNWRRSLTSLFRLMRLSEWGWIEKLGFKKSEPEMINS